METEGDSIMLDNPAINRLKKTMSNNLKDVKEIWKLKDQQDYTSKEFDYLFVRVVLNYMLKGSDKIDEERFIYVKKRIMNDTCGYDSCYSLLLSTLKDYNLPFEGASDLLNLYNNRTKVDCPYF